MSCEGCEQTAKARTRVLDSIIKKAADYAKEHNKAVGIYQTPEGPDFIELSLAAGIPILEIISPNYRPPAS